MLSAVDRARILPSRRSGLTLLEMVVVLAVLAALATMVIPMLDNVAVESRHIATKQTLRQIQETIVNRYASDMKGYTYNDGSTTHFLGTASGTLASVNYGLPVADPQNLGTDGSTTRNAYLPQLAFLSINPLTNDQTSMRSLSGSSVSSIGWNGPYLSPGSTAFPAATQTMPNGRTAQANGFYDVSSGAPLYGMTSASLSGWTDPAPYDAWGSPIVIQGTLTNSSPYTYVNTLTSTMLSGATPLTLTNSVLVSAGPDGVLNTFDDVTLKVQ
ncbi:MAG TPA: prepilin-type N-terminal cleavage/methylation domain-containing protein [Pirellulales bacterium]|nr:prepilin-type N-terminal cleavage/methylation domain-containing protein [Pirellulales bacterium]